VLPAVAVGRFTQPPVQDPDVHSEVAFLAWPCAKGAPGEAGHTGPGASSGGCFAAGTRAGLVVSADRVQRTGHRPGGRPAAAEQHRAHHHQTGSCSARLTHGHHRRVRQPRGHQVQPHPPGRFRPRVAGPVLTKHNHGSKGRRAVCLRRSHDPDQADGITLISPSRGKAPQQTTDMSADATASSGGAPRSVPGRSASAPRLTRGVAQGRILLCT
jgi:hypothetical protein